MWTSITSLAADQHGRVARRQLLAEDCRPGQIDGYVKRGRLRRDGHGVYAVTGTPDTPLSEVMSAVLQAGEGARAAGERLLAASGVRDAAPKGPFVVLVPSPRRLRRASYPWRRDTAPGAGVEADIVGIPSYNIARNLFEAAVTADDERALMLADGVRRAGRRHLGAIADLVVAFPSHPGGQRLLLAGALDPDAAESPAERLLEPLLHHLGVRRQVRIGPYRVDFLVPRLRVVVEYDGSGHEAGARRNADAARDDDLRRRGYEVVRVTAGDMRDPAGVLARITAAGRSHRMR